MIKNLLTSMKTQDIVLQHLPLLLNAYVFVNVNYKCFPKRFNFRKFRTLFKVE